MLLIHSNNIDFPSLLVCKYVTNSKYLEPNDPHSNYYIYIYPLKLNKSVNVGNSQQLQLETTVVITQLKIKR